ncbi:hypothetical protein AVEN_36875-1 [Araneus ventricosus]|uniref:Uncharacterized protein n=1 Tax=Araneus ventricosus TaxID=182803 RepID=A0A4Y2RAF8_ARAVE|nr:hypothetical protein AVEN_36875-1 [Araneus ventricosus]
MTFVPRRFPPTHSSRKIRHAILRRLLSAPPSLFDPSCSSFPTGRISNFLASLRGPNLGRTFALPLASQRGPQKAIRPFQFDFKLFRIPALPIRYANFHSSHTDEMIFLPVFQKSQSECLQNEPYPINKHQLIELPAPEYSTVFGILRVFYRIFRIIPINRTEVSPVSSDSRDALVFEKADVIPPTKENSLFTLFTSIADEKVDEPPDPDPSSN